MIIWSSLITCQTPMATLRRALFRLHQTLDLSANSFRASQSLLRPHLGTVSRFYSDGRSIEVDFSNEESKRRLYNRLLYRSKQRGFLELDLVLGNWVEENIRSMDELRIKALVDVLDLIRPLNGLHEANGNGIPTKSFQEFMYMVAGFSSCPPHENPDLWKWLTGQEQPPEAVNNNPVFMAVRSKVTDNLNNHAAPETRSKPGQPWVRGWDDKRGLDGGPKYGNQ